MVEKIRFVLTMLAIVFSSSVVRPSSDLLKVGEAALRGEVNPQEAEALGRVISDTQGVLTRIYDTMWQTVRTPAPEHSPSRDGPPQTPPASEPPFFWPPFLSQDAIQRRYEEMRSQALPDAGPRSPMPLATAISAPPANPTARAASTQTKPLPVRPRLEYVEENADGTFTAHFGYDNPNAFALTIPIGSANRFAPDPPDRGQVTTFQPGSSPPYPQAPVKVNFAGGTLSWTLLGERASAVALK